VKRTPLKRTTRLERHSPLRPHAPRRRRGMKRSSRYLAWIRTQPCLCGDVHVCCGIVESHHHPEVGAASEARWNDYRAVPLCTLAHGQYHRERDTFASYSINFERAIARLQQLYKISTGKEAA
jgi:hypothetical protein